MRIHKYDIQIEPSSGRNILVNEWTRNYPKLRKISCPNEAADLCIDILQMHKMADESSFLLCLNQHHKLLGILEISRGGPCACCVSAREVYKKALMIGALAIIFVHNHPGGNTVPSDEDLDISYKLWQAGKFFEVPLVDSLIIGGQYNNNSGWYSMCEMNDFTPWENAGYSLY